MVRGAYPLNLLLPVPRLPQRIIDGLVLGLDLRRGVPDHGLDEEFTVAEFADAAALGLSLQSGGFRIQIERSCLFHAASAVGNATEFAVGVLEVRSFGPGGLASVAPFVRVVVLL